MCRSYLWEAGNMDIHKNVFKNNLMQHHVALPSDAMGKISYIGPPRQYSLKVDRIYRIIGVDLTWLSYSWILILWIAFGRGGGRGTRLMKKTKALQNIIPSK
ncbi:unnamed protein product [Fraxinus pennsylvanica]|uniref:Uncharacterized protein n=1 Tax=Fraxinus pennsylvanica TaxID=56036 RepID=A0AAD2EAG8_9LAMI|nr:unnamed protein product [Fraxinus pennsylvanica]